MIADPVRLHNLPRRPASDRHSHQGNFKGLVPPSGIGHVEEFGAVGRQPRIRRLLRTGDKKIGHGLPQRLFVDIKSAGAVGHEDHLFAVGGPIKGKILAIVERQALRLAECARGVEFADVNVRLRNALAVDDPLAISGSTQAEDIPLIVGQPHGRTIGLRVFCEANGPQVRIHLPGTRFRQGVDQFAGGPRQWTLQVE